MKKLLFTFLLSLALSAFAQVPTNGLQLHYSFDGGNATDNSTNSNNGNANNITYALDRFGNNIGAASFNGTNSYLTTPTNMLTSNEVSISLWINTANNNRPIAGQQNSTYPTGGSTHVPYLYLRNNGQLNAGFWTGAQRNLNTSTVNLANNQWHHIVISANGSSHAIYIDGVLTNNSSFGRINLNMINSCFGAARTSSWPGITGSVMRYYSGLMDDIRVYNRTLSASEVTGLFNEMVTSPAAFQQPTAYYSFNAANARDTSGNNRHATEINAPSYTNDRFGNANHALNLTPNSFIELPANSFAQQDITVSTWFKTTNAGGVLLSYQARSISSSPGGAYVPLAYVRNDSTLNAGFWQGATANSKHININVVDGNWHHLVISTGPTGQNIYLDNINVNSTSNTHTVLAMPNSYLGTGFTNGWPNIGSGASYFTGQIDDVRLYNNKLDSTNIDALFRDADPMNPVVHIPDTIFKGYLVRDTLINTNGDTEIQISEANSFSGTINCPGIFLQTGTQVNNFTGIEAFTNVTELNVFRNLANSIDLSSNTKLTRIILQVGSLTSINTTGLSRLKELNINGNNIPNINLTTNDSLEIINLNQNSFTALTFPVLPRLTDLFAENCNSLIDINLMGLDSLEELSLSGNSLLDTVDISNMLKIGRVEIDFSGVTFLKNQNTPSLETIEAARSNLDSINLQNSPKLRYIRVSSTNLTSLDVSNLLQLQQVIAADAQLNTFTTGNNPQLGFIDIPNNNLTSFDPSAVGRNFLSRVWVSGNNISSLDFSGVLVSNVWADSNNLSSFNIKNGGNLSLINNATKFTALGNPNLTCIQVDSIAFSAATWTNVDAGVRFDTNCNFITSLSESTIETRLDIYPNPSKDGFFNIADREKIQHIEVYGPSGNLLNGISIRGNTIDLSQYSSGIYFIRMNVNNKIITKKVMKQ